MDPQTDVMVTVAPNIIAYRENGVWRWRGPPGTTKESVLRELEFQVRRLQVKNFHLQEALDGLKNTP
jgi:hypothetical protein